jgi:hypothetical protein
LPPSPKRPTRKFSAGVPAGLTTFLRRSKKSTEYAGKKCTKLE